jgi:dipeptidyl aminopeptidase/acylaminoacyl peptidase
MINRLADYRTPRWSPTRDRIALALDSNDGMSQIWVYDVGSETLTQLTSVGRNIRPSWSPDGRMIVFASSQGDSSGLHWIPADGSGSAEPVAPDEPTGGTTFWTRDGAWIVYDGQFPPAEDEDVFAVGTGADRAIRTVVATPATEESGAVSPDGRWIAYVSSGGANGSGQVFIRPFLTAGGRWLVSTGTAFSPLWASNDEVMYLDVENGTLTAARLEFGSAVRVVERTPLFNWSQYLPSGRSTPQYDVSRDGQHILALRRSQAVDRLTPIVVLNWLDDVTRLVSAQGGTGR